MENENVYHAGDFQQQRLEGHAAVIQYAVLHHARA